ncbi:unnamed protein product [Linum trigynum]|uniref:Uncharacterized protein n=1 Tax=Linum trigynum TaxID=586398 RepID=A0AAV2FM49_9ROSI
MITKRRLLIDTNHNGVINALLRIGKSQDSTKQEYESENRKHETRFTWFTNTMCVSYVHGRERNPRLPVVAADSSIQVTSTNGLTNS